MMRESCFVTASPVSHALSSRSTLQLSQCIAHRSAPQPAHCARGRPTPPRMVGNKVDDKQVVTDYFNTTGFDRWNRIYSETGAVNSVQANIRSGHAETVRQILEWLPAAGAPASVCDAGCGVGSLALPLAERGYLVSASDISSAMVAEAGRRARSTLGERAANATFSVSDLERLAGRYDTVCCVDVMIHYPGEEAAKMIAHLSGLAERRLIISFAPKTLLLDVLKKIGEFFPGPSKATRAYLHSEEEVRAALAKCGMTVKRSGFTSAKFYYSRILEAVKE